MRLNTFLLLTTAILTTMCGLAVFVGSTKPEKKRSLWFLIATLGCAIWTVSIGLFLSLSPEKESLAPLLVVGIYLGAVIMDVGILAYNSWKYDLGKLLTVIFLLIGAVIIGIFLSNPSVLYESITISRTENYVTLVNGWYYWTYLVYFTILTFALLGSIVFAIKNTKNKGQRIGLNVFFVGQSIAGLLACIFDLILPLKDYSLIWIGPLAISITMLTFYYAIVKYHSIRLNSGWLKVLTYVVFVSLAAIVYMLIFYIIFTAIFRGAKPSTQVIVLNSVMILIVFLLMPAFSELTSFTKSLISTKEVDLPYIIKKLNKIAQDSVDLKELASFLAEHLHFEYVGFLIDGKIYGSDSVAISTEEIKQIELLKSYKENGIWQDFNQPVGEILSRSNIKAVAELKDSEGTSFGQILVGKPVGKIKFERRDLIQLEMIINLVAIVISSESKIHRKKSKK
ncbi:hypothetical protein IKG02_02855 [Candidatus Saccharibacteria bacterium]|nr:hypothetical protein [Candidatus Saccharibacteria bacterium]